MPIHSLTKECRISVGSDFSLEAEIISDWALSMVNNSQAADVYPLDICWCCQSHPTCSGPSDETLPLIKHDFHDNDDDDDVDFSQMFSLSAVTVNMLMYSTWMHRWTNTDLFSW